jgi:murein DD-endopeptidase MepM/ murein hydrolase activator NlpD
MRGALALAALLLSPALAAANPTQMLNVQRPLADVAKDVALGWVDRLQSWAPAPPDLRVLTTEPVVFSDRTSESSGYGWREDPKNKHQKFHHGSDYRAKPGTPIVAAGDGTVIFASRQGGYGNVVYIDHGGGIVTRYGHMRRIETKLGATVSAGELIGQVGSTGRTTGPHLHFEVRLSGRDVNPNTALTVAEIMRESPAAGQLAAFALAPELQAKSRDMQDSGNRRSLRRPAEQRPERHNAPVRQRALW